MMAALWKQENSLVLTSENIGLWENTHSLYFFFSIKNDLNIATDVKNVYTLGFFKICIYTDKHESA